MVSQIVLTPVLWDKRCRPRVPHLWANRSSTAYLDDLWPMFESRSSSSPDTTLEEVARAAARILVQHGFLHELGLSQYVYIQAHS